MIEIRRYTIEDKPQWDEFVGNAKNATFLHYRSYMDYHSNRFADHSLMAFNEGRLVAVLPANEKDGVLYSHQGLTFGGWLTPLKHFNANVMLDVFDAMVSYLKDLGFHRLVYKAVPHIYHRYPAEEDEYALFCNGARISTVNMSSVVSLKGDMPAPLRPYRMVSKAEKEGVTVGESTDFASFWKILSDNLALRYHAVPVHSLEEIELLHSRFPENIKLFMAYLKGEPVAGAVMFVNAQIAHMQYSSASEAGYNVRALGYLFYHLIANEYPMMRYFDFGTSNEQDGRYLNRSLLEMKASYGARGVAYTIYELDI